MKIDENPDGYAPVDGHVLLEFLLVDKGIVSHDGEECRGYLVRAPVEDIFRGENAGESEAFHGGGIARDFPKIDQDPFCLIFLGEFEDVGGNRTGLGNGKDPPESDTKIIRLWIHGHV